MPTVEPSVEAKNGKTSTKGNLNPFENPVNHPWSSIEENKEV